MFSIDSNKSLGHDDYVSDFFKVVWSIVGADVTDAMMEIVQIDRVLNKFNSTRTALIPKIDRIEFASQFRLISCYNVIYMCVSWLSCQRLNNVVS